MTPPKLGALGATPLPPVVPTQFAGGIDPRPPAQMTVAPVDSMPLDPSMMHADASAMPVTQLASSVAPLKETIGERIKSGLADPETRAALFRSGAATLASGNIGTGLEVAAKFTDERKKDREAGQERAAEFALKTRLGDSSIKHSDNQDRNADAETGIKRDTLTSEDGYKKGVLGNQRYNIETDRDVSMAGQANQLTIANNNDAVQRRGQDVSASNNASSNATSTLNAREGNASSERNAALYAGARTDVANINADAKGSGKPTSYAVTDKLTGANGPLAGILGNAEYGGNAKATHTAMAADPELNAAVHDAAAEGYRTGGEAGAAQAMKGVLAGYDYKKGGWFSDGSFTKRPTQAAPVGVQGGTPEIRTDPRTGKRYRRGPDGQPVEVH